MKRSSGFTLIELMVVVGIMILIITIVVTGSFGMSRASGYLAAENIVYNTLQAARQKACTDGKRVVVAFVKREEEYGDGDNYALVTAEAVGTITETVENTSIGDRCSPLGDHVGEDGTDSIWNLGTGISVPGPFTILRSTIQGQIPSGGGMFSYDVITLKLKADSDAGSNRSFNSQYWKSGDPYGFQIGEMQELPTGFKFGVNSTEASSPKDWLIVFEPDGGSFCDKAKSNGYLKRTSANKKVDVKIFEDLSESMKEKAIVITVNDGAISVKRD